MYCRCKKSFIFVFELFVIIISITLLSSCTDVKTLSGDKVKKAARPETTYSKESIHLPLPLAEGEFSKVIGWLSDDTIVYVTNINQGSNVYTYQLLSGKQKQIYKSNLPIVSASISPSRDKILMHASSESTAGTITIIDQEGNNLVEKTIDSAELSFVWNSYDENLLLITAFNEEWQFNVSLLNIETKKLSDSLHVEQPFIDWIGKDEIVYLDWDLNEPTFFAPLVKKKIKGEKGDIVDLENVFQIEGLKGMLLTISIDENKPDQAVYTFLTKDLKPVTSFSIPHLTRFSDWLVPEHDYNQDQKQFYTLKPLSSGAADTYGDGFQLVRYQLDNKDEKLLLGNLENKPICVSPNGEFCLYGYGLENIIIFDTKEVLSMVN